MQASWQSGHEVLRIAHLGQGFDYLRPITLQQRELLRMRHATNARH